MCCLYFRHVINLFTENCPKNWEAFFRIPCLVELGLMIACSGIKHAEDGQLWSKLSITHGFCWSYLSPCHWWSWASKCHSAERKFPGSRMAFAHCGLFGPLPFLNGHRLMFRTAELKILASKIPNIPGPTLPWHLNLMSYLIKRCHCFNKYLLTS